jgi:hypothetical protein
VLLRDSSGGRAGMPTSRPQMAASPMLISPTTAERRRGMCSLVPISA